MPAILASIRAIPNWWSRGARITLRVPSGIARQ